MAHPYESVVHGAASLSLLTASATTSITQCLEFIFHLSSAQECSCLGWHLHPAYALQGFFSFESTDGNHPGGVLSKWIFSWTFAATAATIVSGAVAERCFFRAYLIYTTVMTGLVYPCVVHWMWSEEGWLSPSRTNGPLPGGMGAIDFAGSGVVHITGGGAALLGAYIVGPRKGRFKVRLDSATVVLYFTGFLCGSSECEFEQVTKCTATSE